MIRFGMRPRVLRSPRRSTHTFHRWGFILMDEKRIGWIADGVGACWDNPE